MEEEKRSNRLLAIAIVLLLLAAASAGSYQYWSSISQWPAVIWLRDLIYAKPISPRPLRYYLMAAHPHTPLHAEPHHQSHITADLPLYYQALMLGQTQQNWSGEIWYRVRIGPDGQGPEGWLCERDVFCQPPNLEPQ